MLDLTTLGKDSVLRVELPDKTFFLYQVNYIVRDNCYDFVGTYIEGHVIEGDETEPFKSIYFDDQVTKLYDEHRESVERPLWYDTHQKVTLSLHEKSTIQPIIYQEMTLEQYKFMKDKVQNELKFYYYDPFSTKRLSRCVDEDSDDEFTDEEFFEMNEYDGILLVVRNELLVIWDHYQNHQNMLQIGLRHHSIWLNRRTIGEYLGSHRKPEQVIEQLPYGSKVKLFLLDREVTYRHHHTNNGWLVGDFYGFEGDEEYYDLQDLVSTDYFLYLLNQHEEVIPVMTWDVERGTGQVEVYVDVDYRTAEAWFKEGKNLYRMAWNREAYLIEPENFKNICSYCECKTKCPGDCPIAEAVIGRDVDNVACPEPEYSQWLQSSGNQ